jgi:anti-anti-sigma factor
MSLPARSTPAEVLVRDQFPDLAVIEAAGELDVATGDLLERALRSCERGTARRVVVDLARVTFLDTGGLRAIMRSRDRLAAQQRWLVTRGATGQPRRLLDIGRVHYGVIV